MANSDVNSKVTLLANNSLDELGINAKMKNKVSPIKEEDSDQIEEEVEELLMIKGKEFTRQEVRDIIDDF